MILELECHGFALENVDESMDLWNMLRETVVCTRVPPVLTGSRRVWARLAFETQLKNMLLMGDHHPKCRE